MRIDALDPSEVVDAELLLERQARADDLAENRADPRDGEDALLAALELLLEPLVDLPFALRVVDLLGDVLLLLSDFTHELRPAVEQLEQLVVHGVDPLSEVVDTHLLFPGSIRMRSRVGCPPREMLVGFASCALRFVLASWRTGESTLLAACEIAGHALCPHHRTSP